MPVGPQRWCGIRKIVEWTAGVLACMSRGLADGTTPGRVFLRHAAVGNRVGAHWCGFTRVWSHEAFKRALRVSSPSQS